jgi:hypothetical protein
MLTKLIKYEFRSSQRILPIAFLAALVIAGFGAVALTINSAPLFFLSYFLLVLSGSAVMTITYVVICVRFYKGMFGAEGYLANTFPTDAKTLYSSKTIVSVIWMVISFIISALSWFIVGVQMFRAMQILDADLDEPVFDEMTAVFSQLFSAPIIIWIIFSILVSFLAFLGIAFFCITLSSVKPFSKLGLGSSVLAYIAISVVEYIIGFILMAAFPLSISFHIDSGWTFTTQTMLSWFMDTMRMNADFDPGVVISLGFNIPGLLFAFVLPIFTKRLIERKMILK